MTEVADQKASSEGVAKLWAGKYKTPEEMEEAIKSKDTEAHKLHETNKKLQQSIDLASIAPEHYDISPEAKDLIGNVEELTSLAKAANLPQDKFNKLVDEKVAARKAYVASLEAAKKEVGEPNMNVLTDYVKKNYPADVHQSVLDTLVLNPKARADALAHRDKTLNSRTPGMENGNAGAQPPKTDAVKECEEKGKAYLKNPRSKVAREEFIEAAKTLGHIRFKK